MACRTVLRCVFLTEPYRPLPQNRALFTLPLRTVGSPSKASLSFECYGGTRARDFYSANKRTQVNCSHNGHQPYPEDDHEQGPPQEAVLKAISEVSKTEGRVGQTTNVVIGGTVADDSTNEWLVLDQKVNSYPTVRGFTAIGTGGDDFVQAMVVAVESVIQQPIPEGRVRQKLSSRGKYVSVNIGPIQVSSSEQVQAVYNAMRRDERMKYFL
ncbi:hypothetical protein ACOSP7_018698 [Xanthoceras sorbifolium]|uniref:Phosphoribosylformylglycinamidine synthase n=1 Tax=Xanthoceras sorbifolium TaxID=99658 RepID=A0ABQ8I1R7_9ROSI|nr:hypothetical protein JRO89_XS05G0120600 [Xanthoceras sorbifolium]